jgi:5-methylcytosine-specific restriction enzyme B
MPNLTLARQPSEASRNKLEECKKTLQQLLSILRLSRQEFAYRTMAEVLRYVHLHFELSSDRNSWNWTECMDAQILQKILPKLHGSNRRIGPVLVALATYCEKRDLEEARSFARGEKNPQNFKATENERFASPMFPLSHEKLCEMVVAVRRDQFVSFIQ